MAFTLDNSALVHNDVHHIADHNIIHTNYNEYDEQFVDVIVKAVNVTKEYLKHLTCQGQLQ